ncbi:MAG: hypothetical protein JSV24_06250 [Bacteroidales bacterium]|nr:MAG: hypothetical protein JSV24_06250 [Bacteroidales bacterium]
MKRKNILIIFFILVSPVVYGQFNFQTIAEETDYESTSTYEDVRNFIAELKKASRFLRVEYIATTVEGREIPLMIIGNPLPESPDDLVGDERIVVYIQANIHAGEVEGKEATLMYTRDLLEKNDPDVLENVILLVCPILNADGNEKFSSSNRSHQNGPVNGVGVRHNGLLLDLNRDAMKLETPEIEGVITNVFNRWDPSIILDCHTTNGSYHEEPVTFTWMLNPNGDRSLIRYMRDNMMPDIGISLRETYHIENCYYGVFIDPFDFDKGWFPYACEPRYMSNYIGVRNRLGILNENYVYADFKSRVLGCYYLIHSVIDYAVQHREEIRALISEVDEKTIGRGMSPAVTDSFAIEYRPEPTPEKVTIKAFEVEVNQTGTGRRRPVKTDRKKTVTVPYLADYHPASGVRFPFAYLLEYPDPDIIGLLRKHGIETERLGKSTTLKVNRFDIDELSSSERLNQGHYTNSVKGTFVEEEKEFPAGTIVIRTSQKLGNLIAYLLEPQSDDGLLFWNYLDRYLVPQWGRGYNPYPIYKVINQTQLVTSGTDTK